jgi:hypothetical protein
MHADRIVAFALTQQDCHMMRRGVRWHIKLPDKPTQVGAPFLCQEEQLSTSVNALRITIRVTGHSFAVTRGTHLIWDIMILADTEGE